jgi:hypothetical protein
MQKSLCVIFMFMVAQVIANDEVMSRDWSDYWASGIFSMKNRQYDQAIAESSLAIALLKEEDRLFNHLYVYNSRGQAYFLQIGIKKL